MIEVYFSYVKIFFDHGSQTNKVLSTRVFQEPRSKFEIFYNYNVNCKFTNLAIS